MKLIDATMLGFFSELDLLEFRLEYLNDLVDYFVICEGAFSQAGNPKGFIFDLNKERFHRFKDKIIYIQEDKMPNEPGSWSNEHYLRNSILKALGRFKGDDLVLISDLDEIAPKEKLKEQLMMAHLNLTTISFNHLFCCYYLNLANSRKQWFGTILSNVYDVRSQSPQQLRNNKDHMHHAEGRGFHFSYLGGFEAVKRKFLNCVEPYDKNLDWEQIEAAYKRAASDGGHFLCSDNITDCGTSLHKISLELLPDLIQQNPEKYKHLLLP